MASMQLKHVNGCRKIDIESIGMRSCQGGESYQTNVVASGADRC